MKIHLAIVIGETGYIREDLYVASNIKEFDTYTSQFNDSEEIRLKYQNIIQEFLLDYRNEVKKRETKYGNYRGRIAAYYIQNNQIQFIKIAYRGKPVVRGYDELGTVDEQLMFLKERFEKASKDIERFKLNNRNIFTSRKIQIYSEQFAKFGYILSEDEIYSLRLYFENNDSKYLKDFFDKMKSRLKKKNLLLSGDMVDSNIELDENLENNKTTVDVSNDCNDDLFIKLYSEEDYDNLYNLYDLEEMEKYGILDKKTERRK